MAETPPMFITKEITVMKTGNSGGEANLKLRRPENTMSSTYAKNHGIARVVPANIRAPMGERIAQIMTAPEFQKLPRLHCSKTGKIKINVSWPRQKSL